MRLRITTLCFWAMLIAVCGASGDDREATVRFARPSVGQGETASAELVGGDGGRYFLRVDGKLYPFVLVGERRFAFVGIPWNAAPGPRRADLLVEDRGVLRPIASQSFIVESRSFYAYDAKRRSVPRTALARIDEDRARLARALTNSSPLPYFEKNFTPPLRGKLMVPSPKGAFGVIRRMVYPNNRVEITRHLGTDYRARAGTPILAMNSGRVLFAEEQFMSGKTVVIDHGGGIIVSYVHLSKILVQVGDRVDRGTVVGESGDSGWRSYGAHLHVTVRVYGVFVDPETLLNLRFE